MRFTQVKLVSADPKRLARFYEEALDCRVVLPLTNLDERAGRGVGAGDSDVRILVMAMPGAEDGPTLELITGTGLEVGSGILTFYVEDVKAASDRVVAAGGAFMGEMTRFSGPTGGSFQFVFMTDPEGNVIDLFTQA